MIRLILTLSFLLLFSLQSFAFSLNSFYPSWTYSSSYPHSWLGYDVQSAGDFNCDGAPDFMISAPMAGDPVFPGSRGRDFLGNVYLFFSDPTTGIIPDEPSLIIRGEKNAAFGMSLVSLGNLNPDEDDCDDIAVGSPNYPLVQDHGGPIHRAQSLVGAVTVFYGQDSYNAVEYSDSYSGKSWHVIHSDEIHGTGRYQYYTGDNSFFGQSIAAADVNGDGIKDLLIGAHFDDDHINRYRNSGAVYLFLANNGEFLPARNAKATTDANWSFLGTSLDERFGYALATGDFNNDAYEDVAITSHRGYRSGRYPKTEKVSLFFGSETGLNSAPIVKENIIRNYTLNPVFHNFGQTVEIADVNNDNYDDLIVGAPLWPHYAGSRLKGRVFIYEGADCSESTATHSVCQSSSDILDATQILEGQNRNEVKGVSLASAGDINGDGCNDLLIGNTQPGIDGILYVGSAHLHLGCSDANDGFLSTTPHWRFPVIALDDAIAYNVNYWVNMQTYSGFRLQVPDGEGKMQHSFSMANIGDVTGDGRDDILFGAYWFADPDLIPDVYRGNDRDFGRVYLFEGGVTFDGLLGAQAISHNSRTLSDNSDGTGDLETPSCRGRAGPTKNVWFQFEAISEEVELRLGLEDNHDSSLSFPVVALWDFDPLTGDLTELTCQTGYSTLDVGLHHAHLTPGKRYFISVDNVYTSSLDLSGEFTLELSSTLTNDSIWGAQPIGLNEEITGSNAAATKSSVTGTNPEDQTPISSACTYWTAQNVWYKVEGIDVSTTDLQVQIFTDPNRDFIHLSQASLWEVDSDGNITELTCGHPLFYYSDLGLSYSGIDFQNEYYISIDSFWAPNNTGNAGEFTLVVSGNFTNDTFEGAIDLDTDPTVVDSCVTGNTQFGTTDGFNVWGTTWINGTLWYRFTVLPEEGPRDISIELNNYGVSNPTLRHGVLALTDADQNTLSAVRGGSRETHLSYTGLSAGEYYIAVANIVGVEGHFNLCLE